MQSYTTTIHGHGSKPVFMHTAKALHKGAALSAALERFHLLNPECSIALRVAIVGLEGTIKGRHASHFALTRLGPSRVTYQAIAA